MSWPDLQRLVQTTLSSKRLGTPVFARLLVQSAVSAKGGPAFLAQVVAVANGWLGQPLQRMYALGSVKRRHVALTLEYERGGNAQITWVGTAPRGPALDLLLVGNHGALYHDLTPSSRFEFAADPPNELLAWVQRALDSNRPEAAP